MQYQRSQFVFIFTIDTIFRTDEELKKNLKMKFEGFDAHSLMCTVQLQFKKKAGKKRHG